jgi:hypothetical protein
MWFLSCCYCNNVITNTVVTGATLVTINIADYQQHVISAIVLLSHL